MAIERDLELLDDYLANRLTGGEKEAFERRLESDPTLKSEHQLQQKLVEGIKQARIAELKTMLNNTPIPSLPGAQHLFTKIAAWTVVTGVVVTGAWFYFRNDGKPAEPQHKIVAENKAAETTQSATQPVAPAVEEKAAPTTTETDTKAAEEKKTDKTNKKKTTGKTANDAVSTRPNVFDPTAETETGNNARPEEPQTQPVTEVAEEPEVKPSALETKMIDNDKRYTFNYQFKDGKLLLYGHFERNLYEILEFFSGSKRTAFLYYKDNYYLLNEDNDKIKQLVPINDPVLLNKLKEFRSKSK